MRRLLKIVVIIFSVILLKLLVYYAINELIIANYKADIYNSKLIKVLYMFNFNESYIVYYNDGNIAYKQEKYDEAISRYDEAISKNPPDKRICDIRINKSLAIIYKINSKDKDTIYNELEEAKQNLYNNGCANKDDDNGKSKEAEKLKKEIEKLQEELDKDGNGDNQDGDGGSGSNDDDTPDVEDVIKEREKQANSSRSEGISNTEYIGNYEYYSGKKW